MDTSTIIYLPLSHPLLTNLPHTLLPHPALTRLVKHNIQYTSTIQYMKHYHAKHTQPFYVAARLFIPPHLNIPENQTPPEAVIVLAHESSLEWFKCKCFIKASVLIGCTKRKLVNKDNTVY